MLRPSSHTDNIKVSKGENTIREQFVNELKFENQTMKLPASKRKLGNWSS